MKRFILLTCFTAITVLSCNKKNNDTVTIKDDAVITTSAILNLPNEPYNYANESYPSHIQSIISAFDNTPPNNPITNHGATLGRVLFYDKSLSLSKTVSCASCHKQEIGFSDSKIKSLGHAGGTTRRNSMPLLNLRFYRSGKMFWDERAATLEEQVLLPIQDNIEMGLTLDSLIHRLNKTNYYASLFNNAFGSTEITADRISKALAQFLRSIVTYRSKYDKVQQGMATYTPQEVEGQIFFNSTGPLGACADCHAGGAATNHFQQAVIPIKNPADFFNTNDLGVFEATQNPDDSAKFKIPSLRNVPMTAPYMHNGAVASLDNLFNNNYHKFQLTTTQKQNIIAYLQALTDEEITRDVRFSNPFK